MSKETMYRQCKCTKPTPEGTGNWERVFWGPEKYTVAGNVVKIEENDGEWSQGWTVKEVYKEALPEKLIKHRSHDHTRQREASDI